MAELVFVFLRGLGPLRPRNLVLKDYWTCGPLGSRPIRSFKAKPVMMNNAYTKKLETGFPNKNGTEAW